MCWHLGLKRQRDAQYQHLRRQQGGAAIDHTDLRPQLIEQGVRVNAVSPGPIDTGILDRSMPAGAAEALKARMIANNPMGRFGSPEEIARAVAFLAFDATFTTGAELAVDGGVSQLL